jgi:hypothetical protein
MTLWRTTYDGEDRSGPAVEVRQLEANIPTLRDEATVNRVLRAYQHLFPEITPELETYWNFARTPRHGLLPFLTSNFREARFDQYRLLHQHVESMRQDLTLQERAGQMMDASRDAGVGFSIGLSPWTDDALLDTLSNAISS